jgi:serine/threonine protein kinase
MPTEPTREEELFHQALELPPGPQRSDFLQKACGGDETLRQGVETLLHAHTEAGAVLEPLMPRPFPESATPPVSEKPGDQIGRYKLLQVIGEGGFGIVYMAEQREPVRRRVALKVIKLGMDTKQVIARFEAERQALALMDHPNIARVFDAGATETGRPFFVMELVRGVPITEYCDQNHLSTRQRLELFILVCKAIQHAHQKGVIHRDIKPSNILVTLHDVVPVPKVIDFGIAKAIDQPLTEKTLFTRFEQFMGTPAYMSPEQAEMSGLDVDTRTDIYALGVLLYELLTGRPPFDPQQLLASGLDEMRRTIREQDPPKPSTRLATLSDADLTTAAARRSAEPRKLSGLVSGDLDWVVMKALEKDRTRRYDTANGLAMDIERHLNNEPIIARPPSNLYRFQKLIRRNKLAVTATIAVALALVAGFGVSTWQTVRARRAEAETEIALKDSEEARLQAQAVSKYLVQAFRSPDPNQDGRDIKMADVLDRAVADLDANFAGSPKIKGELLDALGQTYTGLGLTTKALDVLKKARAVDQAVLGPDHPDTLGVNIDIFQTYRIARRLADGVPLLEDTLKRCKTKLGPDDPLTLTTMKDLGDAYRAAGRTAEGISMLEDTLKLCKAKLGLDDPTTLYTMNNLALAYRTAGRPAEAVSMLEEALKLMKAKLGPDDRDTLNTTDNLANAYRAAGRSAEAVPMLEETLRVCKAKFGADHPDTLNTMNLLGDTYRAAGRASDAVPLLEETLKLMKTKLGPDNGNTLNAMNNLALAYRAAGQLTQAVSLLEETLKLMKTNLGPDHPGTLNTANNLADAYQAAGRLTDAVPLSEETLTLCSAKLGARHPTTLRALNNLAALSLALLRQEKFTDAEPLARECLTIYETTLPDDWRTFSDRSLLGGSLLGQKKYAEAEPLLLSGYEGMKQREDKIPADSKPWLKEGLQRLVQLYEATGRPDKAAERKKMLEETTAPVPAPTPASDAR